MPVEVVWASDWDASEVLCFGLVPVAGDLRADPGHIGEITFPGWLGSALMSPWNS